MFKELKVIKLLVLCGLMAYLIFEIDKVALVGIYPYANQPSYYITDSVEISINTGKDISIESELFLMDGNNKKVFSKNIFINNVGYNTKNIVENGFGTGVNVALSVKGFKSGVYLLNGEYPLILKSIKPADICVVYPYANNVMYEKFKGTRAVTDDVSSTSLNRSVKWDKYSINALPFFKELEKEYSINYITDLDLVNNESFSNSKMLIIYGKVPFFSPKMKSNLINYIQGGGNVLFVSSLIMNNVFWYFQEENKIWSNEKKDKTRFQSWLTYNGEVPSRGIKMEATFGGKLATSSKGYIIQNKKHPVFRGVENLEIEIEGDLFIGVAHSWENNKPKVEGVLADYFSTEILAYQKCSNSFVDDNLTGIFSFQWTSTSGKIISLGTEDWFATVNFDDNLKRITRNSIDYLLNNQ